MATLATKMLRHSAVLILPEAVTGWHERLGGREIELRRVHIQRGAGLVLYTRGGVNDMDAIVKAKLWYDSKLSLPHGLDFCALQEAAEDVGDYLRIEWQGVEYRVQGVDELSDGNGSVHHYRLEMV